MVPQTNSNARLEKLTTLAKFYLQLNLLVLIPLFLSGARNSLSGEDSSHHEDGSTDYVEELLYPEDVELPQPLPPRTSQQQTLIILIWLVYFVLVWQYKNYVIDNAVEQVLKFVLYKLTDQEPYRLPFSSCNKPANCPLLSKMLKIDGDNFIKYVVQTVCPKCTKLYHMDDTVVNDARHTFARTCEHVAFS